MKAPWPFGHLGLKILSVGIAIMLWLFVSGEEIVERGLRVPLEFQNLSDRLELLDIPPATVDVRVRGASSVLSHVAPGDLVAVVDLTSARPGRRIFHLTPDQVRAPSGIEVSQVSPAAVALEFEPSSTRTVPVKPSIEGQPAAGYGVGEVTAQPGTVTVVGPASRVTRLNEAITEPVSVEGATAAVHETVTIGVPDSSVRLKSPAITRVSVDVRRADTDFVIDAAAVEPRGAPPGAAIDVAPRSVRVTARGTGVGPGAVTAADVKAFVNLAGVRPGRYTLPVRVDAPPAVTILRVEPASVRIRMRK